MSLPSSCSLHKGIFTRNEARAVVISTGKEDFKKIEHEFNLNVLERFSLMCELGCFANALKIRRYTSGRNNCVIFSPLYTGRPIHCYMLDEFICHLGVSFIFCRFYSIFDGKSC